MIFYFTGTGNSLYVARKLAAPGETVRSITEALEQDDLHVDLADGEPLGFVFPVYFYTVSDPVLDFVRKMTVSNASYVYAVIVCGASIGPAGGFLRDELRRNGLTLSRVDPLVVPDRAVLFYDIDTPEQMARQLLAADEKIAVIRSAIDNRQPSSISGSAMDGRNASKPDMIRIALERMGVAPGEYDRCIMVGDRKYDVLGAKELGIACFGVTYGFGTAEELYAAGAEAVTDTVEGLHELLLTDGSR